VTAGNPAVTAWRPGPQSRGLPGAVVVGLAVLAGLLVFIFAASGVSPVLCVAFLAVPVTLALWRWPLVGMFALVTLGPIHQFLMLLVFHFTGIPIVLRAAQLWKEFVVVVLLAKIIDLAFRRRQPPRLLLLDLLLLLYFAYGVLYVFYPGEADELFTRVMGLRADTFFLLAYFLGRGLPVDKATVRHLLVAFGVMAVIIAAVAGLQFVAPGATNTAFNAIGLREFTTLKQGEDAASFAVRENNVSGFRIARASSLVLSDLALAYYTQLAVPLAGALFIALPGLRAKLTANLLLLSAVMTTVMTVTRSALIASVPALSGVMLLGRAPHLLALVLVQGAVALLPVVYWRNIDLRVLQDIFSPGEASAQGHVRALELSIEVLREQPFGRGLGSAGQVGQLYATDVAITNESWYFQIATEMGAIAGLIFLLIVLGFGIAAAFQYARVRDPWLRALCLGMTGATIGFGLVGIVLHVWEAQTISIVFWLFAGLVMRATSLDARPAGR
jgi:hypothetical protein